MKIGEYIQLAVGGSGLLFRMHQRRQVEVSLINKMEPYKNAMFILLCDRLYTELKWKFRTEHYLNENR